LIQYESAFPGGSDDVRRLFREYQSVLGVDLGFQGFEEELATPRGAYAPPRGTLLLACAGSETLGCVGVRPLDTGRCEMKRLYVAARRTWAGPRPATVRAIAFARASDYQEMVLDALPQMAEAGRLYAALGFTECVAYYENRLPGTRYLSLALVPGKAREERR